MINKGSATYWSTGVILRWTERASTRERDGRMVSSPGWAGRIDYVDDGFCDDNADTGRVSTEGTLHTRYAVPDGDKVPGLTAVVDALLADAERMGIRFGVGGQGPQLYYDGDAENQDYPPLPGWRGMLAEEARRIGWTSPYGEDEIRG